MGRLLINLSIMLAAAMTMLAQPPRALAQDEAATQDPAAPAAKRAEQALGELKARRAELEQQGAPVSAAQADDYYRLALAWINAEFLVGVPSDPYLLLCLECVKYGGRNWYWPGDPLRDWEPLAILEVDDPPVPGGVVLQRCPVSRASTIYLENYGRNWTYILSYEVSIYAAALATAPDAAPQAGNAGWAKIPPGTLAMAGHYEPPASETCEPWEDYQAWNAELKLQEDKLPHAVKLLREMLLKPGVEPNQPVNWCLPVIVSLLTSCDQLKEGEAQLRALGPVRDDSALLQDYLWYAMWVVYEAGFTCSNFSDRQTMDPVQLLTKGYLPFVPLNPLRDWEPVRLLSPEQGFSPGDLCLQWSTPDGYCSSSRGPEPQSFQLSIYGLAPTEPTPELAERIFDYSRAWAVVPPGTVEMTGYLRQSLLESDYNCVVRDTDTSPKELVVSQGNPVTPETISAAERDRLAKKLRAKTPETWTTEELDKYLGYSLWSLYSAVEIYKDVMGVMPEDRQWLVDSGYLSSWPLNPYDGWRPMKILTPSDPFSPGDIVWYSSPDSPRCYELAIYGADPALPLPERCRPLPGHAAWFTPPSGARYTVGAQAETITEMKQRLYEQAQT